MTRIFVVDDDRSIRTAMQAWLEADSFEVVQAGGGRAGLKARVRRSRKVAFRRGIDRPMWPLDCLAKP
jgi:DNA-binding NtrC family response regulator